MFKQENQYHHLGTGRSLLSRPPVLQMYQSNLTTIKEQKPPISLDKEKSVKELVVIYDKKREEPKIEKEEEVQIEIKEEKKAFQFSRYKKAFQK